MNIQLNNIEEPKCECFTPDDKSIGLIQSCLMLDDLRLQIKKAQIAGYYVIFNNKKIVFDENGRSNNWPPGFYDQGIDIVIKLI